MATLLDSVLADICGSSAGVALRCSNATVAAVLNDFLDLVVRCGCRPAVALCALTQSASGRRAATSYAARVSYPCFLFARRPTQLA